MSAIDDVFESWEEMEESGALDKQLKSLEINNLDNMDDMDSPRLTNHSTNAKMIILRDDGMCSQFVNREPTVKILKRPTRNTQDGDGSQFNGDKPKQPIKSLKQREREYAEARKRILGEEKSPEERALQQISTVQAKSANSTNASVNLPNNVLRMPSGPDGTRGFNVRR